MIIRRLSSWPTEAISFTKVLLVKKPTDKIGGHPHIVPCSRRVRHEALLSLKRLPQELWELILAGWILSVLIYRIPFLKHCNDPMTPAEFPKVRRTILGQNRRPRLSWFFYLSFISCAALYSCFFWSHRLWGTQRWSFSFYALPVPALPIKSTNIGLAPLRRPHFSVELWWWRRWLIDSERLIDVGAIDPFGNDDSNSFEIFGVLGR